MFPGGGGMNDRKMQQMMKQMGIEMQELDVEEVVIKTTDEDLVFSDADVQRMDAQGQQTYTIVGEPESRASGEGAATDETDGEESPADEATIPQEDVDLVAGRAGVSKADARAALDANDGDLAAAIADLE